jgi:Tol biopolymer transport system component/DNA-binding winged helix-turn-helix (wHTH) protein
MPRYTFGPFELDPEARLLRRDGEPIPMAGKTLDTLIVLVENRGRLIDKEELLSRVWTGSVVEEANLTQTIFTVRRILGDSPKDHRYIATVAGRGYQFVAPVTKSATRTQPVERETVNRELDQSRKEPWTFWPRNRDLQFGAAGVAIAVLAAGIALWRARYPNYSPKPELLQVSRFTSYPGVETMPAFSPDGREIAYVRAEHDPIGLYLLRRQVGQANIYTKLVGAATELRLTNHPGADYYPTWSFDGQYIAFYRDEPGASGLYIVSALGGQERRITNQEADTSGITWLPDGHHLLVSHLSEGSHSSPIFEISLDTRKEHPVTFPSAGIMGDAWPAISADGKTLAFLRFKDSGRVDVCFKPLTETTPNTPHCWPLQGTWPEGLAWTASDDGIIASAVRTGPHQLWRYSLNGGTATVLTSGEEDAALPTSSRQGNRLAYVLYRRNVNLWELDIGPSQIVKPEDAKPIALSTRTQADPAFSPDGRKIAFLSDRSGASEIWVTDTDTHTSTQLTHFGGPPTGSPSWSPNGLQIAFDLAQSTGTDIFVIPADGGVPQRITASVGDACVPSWSQDGKFVYFASRRGGEFQIWRVAAETGETASDPAVQITHGGGFRAFESSDSKYLYYAKGRGKPGLWRRTLSDRSGGKEEPVLESLQEWGWWALGSEVVYFFELLRSVHPRVRLKAFDIAEGGIRELATLPYPVMNATPAIAASRDGRHLAYTQIDSMEADVMLIENFR